MTEPNISDWLAEAKAAPEAELCGMYLTHNGVVRATPKKQVREGVEGLPAISQVAFSYDQAKVDAAIAEAYTYPGVHYIRVWLNEGVVPVGGSLMYVMIGADIRPNCISALERLVGTIKTTCVVEREVTVDDAPEGE